MRIDLSNLGLSPEAKFRRRLRWGGAACIVVFAINGVVDVGSDYYVHRGFAGRLPNLALEIAIAVMFVGFGAALIRSSRCLARFLDVDSRGFEFEFGDRRPWRGMWADPGLRLQVAKVPSPDGAPPYWVAVGGSTRRACLTESAFLELVREAQSSGIRAIESRLPRNPEATIFTFTR